MFRILLTLCCTSYGFPLEPKANSIHLSTIHAQSLALRELNIGKINFLHTTDIHGWLGSHLTQRDYDATWGDYISFIHWFRENRVVENDLIIIDTGDKRNGNGISDTTTPGGLYSSSVFNELDFDLLTLGNHELYSDDVTVFEYYETAMSEKFKEK